MVTNPNCSKETKETNADGINVKSDVQTVNTGK